MSARGADTQVRPYAKAGIQQLIEVEKGKRIAALTGQADADVRGVLRTRLTKKRASNNAAGCPLAPITNFAVSITSLSVARQICTSFGHPPTTPSLLAHQ